MAVNSVSADVRNSCLNFQLSHSTLNDPKKVSKIVETEYGFHIIQLIEKRGDRINVRHILLKPKVAEKDLTEAVNRMDSLRSDILDKKFTFEDAVVLLAGQDYTQQQVGTWSMRTPVRPASRCLNFLRKWPKRVADMEPGDISEPFIMTDPKTNHEIVAMVKLTSRIPGHKANISDDFQSWSSRCMKIRAVRRFSMTGLPIR